MHIKQNKRIIKTDSAQSEFLQKWNHLVKEGKMDTMKAFLCRVLGQFIVDNYRNHKSIPIDVLMKKGLEPIMDDISGMIDKLDKEALILLIRGFPIKYQKILLMRHSKDFGFNKD